MIDLKKLLVVLKTNNIPVSRLKHEGIVGGASYDKLLQCAKGEYSSDGITLKTINALCKYLNCQPGDIMDYIPDE